MTRPPPNPPLFPSPPPSRPPRPHRRPPERQFAEPGQAVPGPFGPMTDSRPVPAELLSEGHRHGVHQMRPPDLDHAGQFRSEEHTSELQSRLHLVCRLLLEKK